MTELPTNNEEMTAWLLAPAPGRYTLNEVTDWLVVHGSTKFAKHIRFERTPDWDPFAVMEYDLYIAGKYTARLRSWSLHEFVKHCVINGTSGELDTQDFDFTL